MKKYLISWCQNNSAIYKPFLRSMQTFAEHHGAELLIAAGYYRNPTSPSEKEDGVWWAADVQPYLVNERRQLCPNLVLYADVRTQPTASAPLTGYNVFLGKNSGIIPHPKRALECIPTSTRLPRILATTSAVSQPNYSKSRAGAKGDAHHVLGALVVEVDRDGTYFLRHVSAERDGSFTDLATHYTPEGVQEAKPALSLTLGDLHVGQDDVAVLKATKALARLVKPKHIVLHDVLDFRTRNHHEKGMRPKYQKRDWLVCHEVEQAAVALTGISEWADKIHVIRSNHDEAVERWLDDTQPYHDPANAPYWHAVWSRCFEHYADHGEWPDVFAMEAKRLGTPKNVLFLARDESLMLGGTEFGFHGDKGVGGSRGSPQQYAKLGVKVTTGHTHVPGIRDGAYTVGVTGKLNMSYNLKPTSWANAHCLQYASGKRTIVFVVNGKFTCSGTKKRGTKDRADQKPHRRTESRSKRVGEGLASRVRTKAKS